MNWIDGFWFIAGAMCGFGVAFLLFRGGRAQPTAGAPAGATSGWSRWSVLAGAGGLVVVVGLYLWLGHPELIGTPVPQGAPPHAGATAPAAGEAAGGAGGGSMDAAVAGLEARLAQGKGSDADWNLLAQSYEFLGRSADAALARKKQLPATRTPVAAPAATGRAPDAATLELINEANTARRARNYAAARDTYVKLVASGAMTADTWADYADVTASLKGGSLAGEAGKYITEALKIDPHHPKALWLQGSMQHEAGRYAEALATWERLAAVLDPASSDAKLIAANIAEDRRLSGVGAGSAGAGSAKPAVAAAASGAVLSGEITIADALKARASAGQPLFIFAKAVGQPGPPVAVLRTTTGQWPLRFRLDDSLAMMPTRTLSTAGKVTVEARISRSGQAIAAAGDLQGASGAIDPKGAGALRIVIDRVVN